ncbi:hypothetical protein F1643_21390 [Azospirillum sp. INR13]|uniref:hypothetical protein n=1 Tax=Azospirillum sp. INR13 TaxID=2596919 RepID=UPI00189287F2|nr:hypothetical protein [Azospirillum sp. INR13]MBF5096548.1 hypothetical protein [Azospirillum sp. INR13]
MAVPGAAEREKALYSDENGRQNSHSQAAAGEKGPNMFVFPRPAKKLPEGSKGWQATPRIGRPWSEIPEPTEAELFPILSA